MRAPRLPEAPPAAPLAARVKSLSEAADLAVGRSDEAAVAEAKRVASQVDRRLAFSGDHTVVALAGATGSGKSSLFNAVAGQQLARSGVRRPTTDTAMAACWGDVPRDLLDWLDVTEKHAMDGGGPLDGLVLLDLPDHDSTQTSHRTEVDRLVKLVDAIVWVLDPQKYADAALHERYLRPLADYADVMVIVLNQADLLPPADLAAAMADLRALLAADGLGQAPVLTTSALTGLGIDQLRDRLAKLAAAKRSAAQRLQIDVSHAARGMLGDVSRNRRRAVSDEARAKVLAALDEAAGVPQVVGAVNQATRQRGAEATGWPVISWINRLKPDPLRRLRGTSGVVTMPGMDGAVAQSRVSAALRDLGAEASADLPAGWAGAVKRAASSGQAELAPSLDAALAKVDLGVDAPHGWWRVMRVIQWVLIGVVVGALVWAVLIGFLGLPRPTWRGLSWPLLIIGAGLVLGVIVALICHAAVGVSARRRAGAASTVLRRQVADVVDATVIAPINAELDRYGRFVGAVARAL